MSVPKDDRVYLWDMLTAVRAAVDFIRGYKTRYLIGLAATLIGVGAVCVARGDEPVRLSADLKAEVAGPLLADFPLLLNLTITNTGDKPFYYWCGGPGGYPRADVFVLTATDRHGRKSSFVLHNGQYEQGSGVFNAIEKTENLPAASDPLPAGIFTIQVAAGPFYYLPEAGKKLKARPAMVSKPFTVTIVDDKVSLASANSRLRDRETTEPFAQHVAEVYGIDPIVQTWLNQLVDDHSAAGLDATGHLQYQRRLPPGGDAALKKAAAILCQPGTGHNGRILLPEISLICSHLQSEDAVDTMLIIANQARDETARDLAVFRLAHVPGQCAENALLGWAADKNSPPYWSALEGLAIRHNSAAVKPLLQAATDPSSAKRPFAIEVLERFRELPEVHKALEAALSDSNLAVKEAAKEGAAMEGEWLGISVRATMVNSFGITTSAGLVHEQCAIAVCKVIIIEGKEPDMLQSVKGVCRDGRVELLEPVPAGANGQVIVTFLGSESVDLAACGIDESQAADLRHRLATFADDWHRPEMDVYDGA